MAKVTIGYGAILILLGLGGFFGTGAEHVTALIPAFFGVVVVGLGVMALREHLRMHAMHGAVLLALIGIVPTAKAILKLPALLSGDALERPVAVAMQAAMCLLSIGYIVLAVRSFIAARRARVGGASA